jgi:hypothetical protein
MTAKDSSPQKAPGAPEHPKGRQQPIENTLLNQSAPEPIWSTTIVRQSGDHGENHRRAAIGVLLRFALRQYYASPLYADTPTATMIDAGASALSGKKPD